MDYVYLAAFSSITLPGFLLVLSTPLLHEDPLRQAEVHYVQYWSDVLCSHVQVCLSIAYAEYAIPLFSSYRNCPLLGGLVPFGPAKCSLIMTL
jgi:hypothetical protein